MEKIGYNYLIEKYNQKVIPNWHQSYIISQSSRSVEYDELADQYIEFFPATYKIKNTDLSHLVFALKFDGTNLLILHSLFNVLNIEELTEQILSKITSKYHRIIWFLYEYLTKKQLCINNLQMGNYVHVLDENKYFSIQNGKKISRQRVINNLLGSDYFLPIVRKTDLINDQSLMNINNECEKLFESHSKEIIYKAANYLNNKETKSSFEIENVSITSTKAFKFSQLLELSFKKDFCTKRDLIELQNLIVDSRFKEHDYRKIQNYVGQSISLNHEIIHYISPKPEDIQNLMMGLIETNRQMYLGNVESIIHAAVIAFGFVYLHPFEDGNGRIHRFLLINILALKNFVKSGIILPLSTIMLNNRSEYDKSLETFSKRIMQIINYELHNDGSININNNTEYFYKYLDLTKQAEYVFRIINIAINSELNKELEYLTTYYRIKSEILKIIDMPDKQLDLFIQLCLQNGGKLSLSKKEKYFSYLTQTELNEIEKIITNNL